MDRTFPAQSPPPVEGAPQRSIRIALLSPSVPKSAGLKTWRLPDASSTLTSVFGSSMSIKVTARTFAGGLKKNVILPPSGESSGSSTRPSPFWSITSLGMMMTFPSGTVFPDPVPGVRRSKSPPVQGSAPPESRLQMVKMADKPLPPPVA